ncbi:MAG: T9SS type A sorting domain-containing protein [Prevotella sp.]|nr:T9SS type A sorting domain-containing protein [Prevotella sp.]
MKKFTYLFCVSVVAAIACPTNLKAQEITSEVREYRTVMDTEDYEWDIANGILRVSDNGKYAVCSAPNNYPYPAMFVDIESNEVTFLNTITGEYQDKLIVEDVANDGLMGGSYIARLTSSTGSDSLVWHPGVRYLDGDWIDLPLPEKALTEYLSYDTSLPDEYTHFVKRVSPDGKVLLGQVWYQDTVEVDGVQKYGTYYEPMLWYFDPDTKTCTGMKEFRELPYTGQGFIPYDMTDDGSVIVGMSETAIGDQCPAYIKDGEIVFLETPSDDGVFWAGGMASCIDNDGNIYYKYPDDSTNSLVHSGKYNVYTGERTYYPDSIGHVMCGTPGLVIGMTESMYGPCAVFEGDTSLSVSGLTYPENISDDGKVIAGANLDVSSYSPYDYPALLVFSDSPVQSGIRTIRLDGIALNKRGNIITISGDYDKAEIINAAGQVCGYTDSYVDMSGLANGIYMIKVCKGNQTNVYKIMK